jgi:hypothetical protein
LVASDTVKQIESTVTNTLLKRQPAHSKRKAIAQGHGLRQQLIHCRQLKEKLSITHKAINKVKHSITVLFLFIIFASCKKEEATPIYKVEYKLIDNGSYTRRYNIIYRNESGGTTSVIREVEFNGIWSTTVNSKPGQTFFMSAWRNRTGTGSDFKIQAIVNGKVVQESSIEYDATIDNAITISGEIK